VISYSHIKGINSSIGIELPSSPHYTISKIMDVVLKLDPYSILDIGTGFGKYGVLCREYLELWDGRQNYHEFLRKIDGVEAHGKYITPLHRFVYNNIYSEDVLTLINRIDYKYDLSLLIDVFEHFDKPAGRLLLEKLLSKSKGVLISIPKKPSAQKNAFNNDYETHRAKWTRKELSSFSNSFFLRDKTHLVVYIGTNESVRKLKKRLLLGCLNPGIQYLNATYAKFIRSYLRIAKRDGHRVAITRVASYTKQRLNGDISLQDSR
jgi:hypothetical protein